MNTQEWRRHNGSSHSPSTVALHEQITRLERNLAALQAAMGQAQQEVVQRVREIHQRDQELLRLRQQMQAILRGETDSLLALLHESEERGHALARQVAYQRQGMAMAVRLLHQHAGSQALDLLQGMVEGQ
jgi:regulator of replication initiation timing